MEELLAPRREVINYLKSGSHCIKLFRYDQQKLSVITHGIFFQISKNEKKSAKAFFKNGA